MKIKFLSSSFLNKTKRNLQKFFKKSIIRNSILSVVLVIVLVFIGSITYRSSNNSLNNQVAVQINNSSNTINPLSAVSTAAIAYQVASMTGIYEIVPAANTVQSQTASQDIPLNDQLIAKPIILATSIKTRADIIAHRVVPGDSLSSLAITYGVTSQSISESNNINYGYLKIGSIIYIPPINGIVYVVKAGDTPQSLANTYNANASDIISFNDAELSGLKVGERIVIPNGSISAPITNYYSNYVNYNYTFGASTIYGANGYDFGQCTWYVAGKRNSVGNPIPKNLGNADTWYYIAQLDGLRTGLTPEVGAVMWFPSSYISPLGHVAYVEAVNADGSVTISEMNWRGWDVVDTRTIPANQLGQNRYIY